MENLGRPERPILGAADDTLAREGFVRRLTDAVINRDAGIASGVVVGITGQWGSGKSSILNMVAERVEADYPDAIVVRFDPWLMSGRDDLVSAFMSELLAKLKADTAHVKKLKGLVDTVTKYGEKLAPAANLLAPGAGFALGGLFSATRARIAAGGSLTALHEALSKELATVDIPIIVLIDEVDRVEDGEIRTIAQLVRAVADFPRMSYVLAYDPERVAQALGAGAPDGREIERGRSYLEKIVQLQIPLPITMPTDVFHMVTTGLKTLSRQLQLPDNFNSLERYNEIMQIACGPIVSTPRDVSRLLGTYHALAGMLGGEVDWVDLIGYSILLIKTPEIVGMIRREPGLFIAQVLSRADSIRELGRSSLKSDERLSMALGGGKYSMEIESLVGLLFPMLSAGRGPAVHRDAISQRRPLLTTLHLGLMQGFYNKDEIEKLVQAEPLLVAGTLKRAYENDTLEGLLDRFEELYPTFTEINHVRLWKGFAEFVRKPDAEWMTSFQGMHEVIRRIAGILERVVGREPKVFSPIAVSVFTNLRNTEENVLTAVWLRSHIKAFGLYGWRGDSSDSLFLNEEQTAAQARNMAAELRSLHLTGRLLPFRWDLQPVYTMMEMGQWDDPCRKAVDILWFDARAVDGMTLMLFGSYFTTSKATVGQLCSLPIYLEAVRKRLASGAVQSLHESVVLALEKAATGSENGEWGPEPPSNRLPNGGPIADP